LRVVGFSGNARPSRPHGIDHDPAPSSIARTIVAVVDSNNTS
jgi:hypothetical protein